MAIPFFRKGPQVQEPSSGDRAGSRASKPDPSTSTLDFTQGDARALAQAAGKIHVDELSDADHPAVEEAAILFANASDDVAAAVLEAAIDGGAEGNDTLWNMLFDLYRVVGQREAFEQRGVAYAEQFGRSPPIWADEDTTPAAKPSSRDATPSVALTGTLGAAAKAQFDQISRIATKAGKLRIDLGKLRGADEAGCEVLVSGLKALRQARVQVTIVNARNMLPMIEGQAVQGQRQGQAIWLMVLELLQALAEVERFEEVALDYAITFEESPPSYEAPIAAPAPTMKNSEAVASAPALELVPIEEEAASFVIEGDLTSAQSEVIRKLAKYGADRKLVEVDASRLRRMDFVTAGNLFNVLVQFQSQGKLCEIRGLNAMVAALLRVMGVHQVATMETRRI